jgi:hypothetical protein
MKTDPLSRPRHHDDGCLCRWCLARHCMFEQLIERHCRTIGEYVRVDVELGRCIDLSLEPNFGHRVEPEFGGRIEPNFGNRIKP